ncbi:MAG TPA: preprotein translocase subunit SecE [Clostridiaceae bacterium]|nr:preprotein translocase subunit SecE [Clostridiaceae bacterium]
MADNVKVSKFANARKKFVRFFKDTRSELKKVIWPTKQQMVNNTLTVLFFCLVVGIIIWLVDFGLTKVLELTLLK